MKMSKVEFIDNTASVIGALSGSVTAFLLEVGAEVEREVIKGSRVDTGGTKRSWGFRLKGADAVAIGSTDQNAIWEEFGTGAYAEGGKGRKSVPWFFTSPRKIPGMTPLNRNKRGEYVYRTSGKRPNPNGLRKSMDKLKPRVQKIATSTIGTLGGE